MTILFRAVIAMWKNVKFKLVVNRYLFSNTNDIEHQAECINLRSAVGGLRSHDIDTNICIRRHNCFCVRPSNMVASSSASMRQSIKVVSNT